jgi:predicted secreted protein
MTSLQPTPAPAPAPAPRVRVLVLVAMLATLDACGSVEAPKLPVAQAVIQKPGQKIVRVSIDDSGADIVLEPSQQLAISLELKVRTGLDWSLVDFQPGVLAVQRTRFEPSSRPIDYEQGIGYSEWQMKAEAPGRVTLKFDLRRARSLDPPAQTVTFNVSVQ